MATNFTTTTLSTTYKDDFKDSDNYHRILFNSGRALQARELTQMQTILQKQIERLGNNIFKEGAIVKPGGTSIDNQYLFVKLNTSTYALGSNVTKGMIFTGGSSNVKVKILETVGAAGADPATIYVQYIHTSSSSASTETPITVSPGEVLSEDGGSINLQVQSTNTTENPAVGRGTRVSFANGIYYIKGNFVFTENQSVIASKYTDVYSGNIGYKVTEQIVTAADDTGLYDNQGTSPNLASPGADRYRIRLSISKETDLAGTDNFIHIATIKGGVILDSTKEFDQYNIPNKLISQRIKENSGDYMVKPYKINFAMDSENTHLRLKISDGIVVIDGNRAARSPSEMRVRKPTATTSFNNQAIGIDYGNYVKVGYLDGETGGIPGTDSAETVNIRSATNYGGSTIGTARVRAITKDTNSLDYRYHLFDIQMNEGTVFQNAKSFGNASNRYFNPVLENSLCILKEPSKNQLLFPLPRTRPSAITDISLTMQERFTANVSSNAGSITTTNGVFVNTSDWIFSKQDSDIVQPTWAPTVTSGFGISTANFTTNAFTGDGTYNVLADVYKGTASIRSKTLPTTPYTILTAVEDDGNGLQYIKLGYADIHEVTEIVQQSDSSIDLFNRFVLDNGQRDNYYDIGRLILKPGYAKPAGTISVKFKAFQHGPGNFFASTSYSTLNYSQIPNYRLATGQSINLRDYIDFRPVKSHIDSSYSGAGSILNLLPKPTSIVSADTTYYLPQAYKLVIDTDADARLVEGASQIDPSFPEAPIGAMGIYDIMMHPNTLNDSDVTVRQLHARRYTMKDINKLENRLGSLEELTALNMLEMDTKNIEVLDSAGNDRTKSGFIIDNFSTQLLSELGNSEYAASIDPTEQILRPRFFEDNVRMIYDSAASRAANGDVMKTIKKGDNVYIYHTESEYLSSSLASEHIQINPFDVIMYEGQLKISPESDEWRDTVVGATKAVDGGRLLNTTQAYLWDNWSWNWGGKSIDQLSIGSTTNTKDESNSSKNISKFNKVIDSEIVKEVIGTRVLQTALIPWMRSKKIHFKASGLRPNAKIWVYFDGDRVGGTGSDWCKAETFKRYSDTTDDYGNSLTNATAHPEGSTALTTDNNGGLEGSFFIPNNDAKRFPCGYRELILLDVSAYNPDHSTAIARTSYISTGHLDTVEQTVKSTRVLTIAGQKTVTNKPQPEPKITKPDKVSINHINGTPFWNINGKTQPYVPHVSNQTQYGNNSWSSGNYTGSTIMDWSTDRWHY